MDQEIHRQYGGLVPFNYFSYPNDNDNTDQIHEKVLSALEALPDSVSSKFTANPTVLGKKDEYVSFILMTACSTESQVREIEHAMQQALREAGITFKQGKPNWCPKCSRYIEHPVKWIKCVHCGYKATY